MSDDNVRALLMSYKEKKSSKEELLSKLNRKGTTNSEPAGSQKPGEIQDIAVIGISSRFPGAENVEQFWDLIKTGKNAISEVPKDRFNIEKLMGNPLKEDDKTNCRWGGFLKDIDLFDPLFFNISPKEAEMMDPQQRLFLMEAWKAIVNSGYSMDEMDGKKCGVFVGHADGDYKIKLADHHVTKDAYYFMGNSGAILSARIAYLLNLKGPTISLDTACSSSLVAIHLACESIRAGDCDMAITGGTSIFLTPQLYLLAASAGMLSSDGQCRPFDNQADGFVPAEGVGVVILKALSKAQQDKDHIYAVIKGSGLNQDGRSNGITAPCAVAQTSLERQVYDKYHIDPSTISYVETHGTGTKLGDPIEVSALLEAFKTDTNEEKFCGLGSVKANIGHTQLAAGSASVIKAVLMLQHKQLPPQINFSQLNNHIELENSPFYINSKLKEWESQGAKRRIAVSGFGFSGTNAHVVLEEYNHIEECEPKGERSCCLICISAKSRKAVFSQIEKMKGWILENKEQLTLERISYSLLQFKSHFNCRAAFVAADLPQLLEQLNQLLVNPDMLDIADIKLKSKIDEAEQEEQKQKIDSVINELASGVCRQEREAAGFLAEAYKAGYSISAKQLYPQQNYQRMAMPEDSFDLQSYWLPDARQNHFDGQINPDTKTILDRDTFYIKDHKVDGVCVLPGAAYLEIVSAASNLDFRRKPVVFERLIWQSPVEIVKDSHVIATAFTPAPDSEALKFSVSSEEQVHCQGLLRTGGQQDNPGHKLDISAIKAQFHESYNQEEHYRYFTDRGMLHGKSLQGVKKIYCGEEEALACLELPLIITGTEHEYRIHPALMDSALQVIIGIKSAISKDNNVVYLPFSVKKISVYDHFGSAAYSLAKQTGTNEFSITVADSAGVIIAEITGLVMRKISKKKMVEHYTFFAPAWKEQKPAERIRLLSNAVIIDALTGTWGMWPEGDKNVTLNSGNYIYVVRKCDTREQMIQKGVYDFFDFVKNLLADRKKNLNILYLYDQAQPGVEVLDAIKAFGKTILLEQPLAVLSTLSYEIPLSTEQMIAELSLNKSLFATCRKGVKYAEYMSYLEDLSIESGEAFPAKRTYLITGGNGKLAGELAEYLTESRNSDVILLGREEQLTQNHLKKNKKIFYYQADLRNQESLTSAMSTIQKVHENIEGVFHCAGIHRDALIQHKSAEDFRAVLAPKLDGTDHLMALLSGQISFVIFFSSIASVCGVPGQCDYSYANGYLNEYALRHSKEGCRCISIAWPYWEAGGMQINEQNHSFMHQSMGIETITAQEGIKAMEAVVSSDYNYVIFMKGNRNKFIEYLNKTNALYSQENWEVNEGKVSSLNQLYSKVQAEIYDRICNLIRIDRDKLNDNHEFTDYGFDSILFTDLANEINESLGTDIMPTIFFNINKVGEFISFLCDQHYDEMVKRFGLMPEAMHKIEIAPFFEEPPIAAEKCEDQQEDIAVIGMSGIMPQSSSLQEFFRKLEAETDFVTEIPPKRWDWHEMDNQEMRWGAFMQDIDTFDACFFSISPREAELMDPQQRLLLECVWHTIEDAGYKASELRNSNTGVFIGVSTMDYTDLSKRMNLPDSGYTSTGRAHSILANRISYVYDFHGPSEPIDTACSSSLIAIIHGMNAIKNRDCDMAIAGGVNVIASEDLYVAFSKSGMLAKDGKCKSFDKSADGYVRGEGVGTILLKSLSKAIADKDRIYAVIRGGAVNHGGAAVSLTAPNAAAQSSVIIDAFQKAGVNPHDVTYMEAHGTGTKLGDPIELEGLKKAFEKLGADHPDPSIGHCYVGSVKSNIGHLEAAAGIASVFKVILAMKNKKIPASIHIKELNPYLGIEHSPFRIVQKTTDWVCEDGKKRIAGISSYGYGGANAHLLIEEYHQSIAGDSKKVQEQVYLYSSYDKEQLHELVNRHITFLNETPDDDFSMGAYAYTLQTGREEMKERLAVVAGNKKELEDALGSFVNESPMSNCYFDHAQTDLDFIRFLSRGSSWNEYLQATISKKEYDMLAALWVRGVEVNWLECWRGQAPYKISIPLYPFRKDRYWLPAQAVLPAKASAGKLHPLVDENVSTLDGTLFKKYLSCNEFYIKDHQIQGVMMLPGVAYLEMARAAGELAAGEAVGAISDVVWIHPIIAESNGVETWIDFTRSSTHSLYHIYNQINGEKSIASQGKIITASELSDVSAGVFDINTMMQRCPKKLDRSEAYQLFRSLDFQYGSSFEVLDSVCSNDSEAVGTYQLSDQPNVKDPAFKLLIPVMDAALQTIMGTGSEDMRGKKKQFIPFSLKRLIIFGRIPEKGYTYARLHSQTTDSSVRKFDISITDISGNEIVRFEEFSSREVNSFQEKLYYTIKWEPEAVDTYEGETDQSKLLLVMAKPELRKVIEKEWKKKSDGTCIGVYDYGDFQAIGEGDQLIRIDCSEDYQTLISALNLHRYSAVSLVHAYAANEQSLSMNQSKDGIADIRIKKSFYSLSYMIKALAKANISTPIRISYLYKKADALVIPEYEMVNGMVPSISALNPGFSMTTIGLDGDAAKYSAAIVDELRTDSSKQGEAVWFKNGMRYKKKIVSQTPKAADGLPLIREGDRIVITGGLGKLGKLFTAYFVSQNIRVVLMGRRELQADQQWLNQLNREKKCVCYVKGDLSNYQDAKRMFEQANEFLGTIDGVIHAAGISGGGTMTDGNWEEYEEVLKPKVYGIRHIDDLIRNEPIRYLICFSSVAAVLGDFGACCYACANEYLNSYVQARNLLAAQKICTGKTYAVDWGIWAEGNMKLPADKAAQYRLLTGMMPISAQLGLEMFADIISGKEDVVIAAVGDRIKADRMLLTDAQKQSSAQNVSSAADTAPVITQDSLRVQTMNYLRQVIADAVKADILKVESKTSFESLGIDSIMVMEIHDVLDLHFKNLSRTLFFEYSNLQGLSEYFMKEHQEELIHLFGENKKQGIQPEIGEHTTNVVQPEGTTKAPIKNSGQLVQDIAIIGMSGRYPMAENLEQYYDNLKNGRDCIEEIPMDRFDHRLFYSEHSEKGKITCKWGGFLKDIDKFDEEFFGILPKVATLMDPQERLMLETAWQAIEDSGYKAEDLTFSEHGERVNDVGVFIGMMYDDYKLIETQELLNHNYEALTEYWNSPIANRISYIFDFRGPSMIVDSACSSSLTTLHMACRSIMNGECRCAIAGGVSLSLHPSKFLRLSDFGMSSPSGRSRSFANDADGYVPGEGVGAVLLKPLAQAEQDGDNIYAVIKGTSINHGGRANGFTVPNPNAQSDVILNAMKTGGMDPRSISYVETHGSGTSLGDPIEITGLTKAFRRTTSDKQFCKIGSVKSNIGHCEGAAGISQITKVALQLKHKKLFPSLHSAAENSMIDFKNSPFIIQKQLEDWQQPEIEINGELVKLPRRAGISSFGAGGSNAHIIMEEYVCKNKDTVEKWPEYLILISADQPDSLNILLKNWLDYFKSTNMDLHNISFTTVVGRVYRNYRFAMVVRSMNDAVEKITDYLASNDLSFGSYYGITERSKDAKNQAVDFAEAVNVRKLGTIASMWVEGFELEYASLFDKRGGARVSVPKHPLRKNHHWIKTTCDINQIAKDIPITVKEKESPIESKVDFVPVMEAMDQTTEIFSRVSAYLIGKFCEVTGIKEAKIDGDRDFSEYGIDSIGITNFGNMILSDFPEMSDTALYAYQTIEDLANYMCDTYEEDVRIFFNLRTLDTGLEKTPEEIAAPEHSFQDEPAAHKDIAIIGVNAKLPESETWQDFWDILAEKKDTIHEIDRWDMGEYYDPVIGTMGKTYCKSGSFLKNIDQFDAPFFNIPKSEADMIDPQERLFLQSAWNAVEDAGYSKQSIDRNTGVYVGVTTSSYHYIGFEESMKGNLTHSTTSFASIANRISYILNLNGPSMPVDTMCSSTAAAIYMACKAIQTGECNMAIAGGVNLYSHPMALVNLSQMKLLSQDNKNRSFCEGGTGFIPGEAVGAVILKPLETAQKDGDFIYGVIKGGAAGHIGKTTTYFSSNPLKQADIIERAIQDAQIPKESISYVETMTVGSEIGDSLEVEGLKQVFQPLVRDHHEVAIGSVKPNIGHAEAASGIGQLIKVLLQFRYKQLTPTLLNARVSSKIKLENSPLRIQQITQDWQPVSYNQDGTNRYYPRRAGISSFGAGGYGVHLILEESASVPILDDPDTERGEMQLIPISSNTKDGITRSVGRLLKYCRDNMGRADIRVLAQSLQHRKDSYKYRMLLTADSLKALQTELKTVEAKNLNSENIFLNFGEKHLDNRLGQSAINWLEGEAANWETLQDPAIRRLPAPGYSFQPIRCWVDKQADTTGTVQMIEQGKDTLSPFYQGILYKFLKDYQIGKVSDLKDWCSSEMYASLNCFVEILVRDQIVAVHDNEIKVIISKDNASFWSVVENPQRRAEFFSRLFPELQTHFQLLCEINNHMEDILKERTSIFEILQEKSAELSVVIENKNRFDHLLLDLAEKEIEEKIAPFTEILRIVDDHTYTANMGNKLIEIGKRKQLQILYYIVEEIDCIREAKASIIRSAGIEPVCITKEQARQIKDISVVIYGRKMPEVNADSVPIRSIPVNKDYYVILYQLMKDSLEPIELMDEDKQYQDKNEVTAKVLHMVAEELGVSAEDIDLSADLSDYGINSILLARLFTQLTEQISDRIEPKDVLQSRSVKELVSNIESKITDETAAKKIYTAKSGNCYEYTMEGEGEPLLILTALAFTPNIWNYQKNALKHKYRLIMPTLPAHGTSPYQGQKLSFDTIADDLKEFLDYLEIESAYMIGWCMTGNILQKMMMRCPLSVKKACLIATTPEDASIRGINSKDLQNYSKDPLSTYELEFLNIYGGDKRKEMQIAEYMELIKTAHCQVDSTALLYYIDELFKFDMKKEARQIEIPTLLIAGKWDITYPPEQVELIKTVFPNASFQVFEKSGHLPFISERDRFNQQIEQFFI